MSSDQIASILDRTPFSGLTIWKCADGYQANLNLEFGGAWRIEIAPTAAEALRAVLRIEAPEPAPLPPPPPFEPSIIPPPPY